VSASTVALLIGLVSAAYMAWNIGANDVANAMGTSVGSGALSLAAAVVLAGIFEFAGASLVGTHVTETIRTGILDTSAFAADSPILGPEGPRILLLGMVSALLAAGLWLQLATSLGLPVSTTHSIVGALVGFALVSVGSHSVRWGVVAKVSASWVLSPILGAMVAAGMFLFVSHGILRREDPAGATRRLGPHLVGAVAFLLVLSFIYKVLGHIITSPPWWSVVGVAAVLAGLAFLMTKALIERGWQQPEQPFAYVERVFGRLQIVTACYVAFAHGANDVANAVGPAAAVVQIHSLGSLPPNVPVPEWILVAGGIGIVVGLATWGYKVIATVGGAITELTPTRGFSAEFGAATTVLVASRMGLPVSTTHCLVGAVIGVGLARGLAAINLRMVGRIVNSWIVTLPVAGALAVGLFEVLRYFLA